ncbi:MAG TPA: protein TolR [Rhodospirillaceae bacterium]|nr:MAG: hypothetical protein A2018_05955 [Alphaproteobacteria bacterium GWF2_58_20]HAU29056.1 protein TolR [Rhodospirillaceae bacterium]
MPGGFGMRGTGRRRGGYRPLTDINMTPMIDVTMTLLIVFMISAPLLTVGVPVELPEVAATSIGQNEEPAAVTVAADGTIFLQEKKMPLDELLAKLSAMKASNPKLSIVFRGDKGGNYGRVMEVLGALNAAGFTNLSLVTETPDQKKK